MDHHLVFSLLILSLDYVCYVSCFKMGIISLNYANMIIGCLRGWNKKKTCMVYLQRPSELMSYC